MKDELHQQILERLSGTLDGDTFEAAAVDLLQPIYPTLTPIKGGGDDGQDGYFFNINGASGPLVCTTGKDVSGNLRKNLQKYKTEGRKGRSVISVTSQALTTQRNKYLYKVAEEEGFTLLQVHEQSDIALRLYRNGEWLKKLLNLESKQQALSVNPVTPRPVLSLSVRGREDVLKWLAARSDDCIIVGQPGSGKTFVVRDFIMLSEGLFVVSDNTDEIAAEVRTKQPNYLVLDDAHTKLSLLRSLRQIRQDTGSDFKIIATGWLSQRDTLKNEMTVGEDAIFELELQGRDTILDIIKDCGVRGPDVLLYQMVTQAEGKPGLAATLSQLVLAGEAQDVYIGDALGKHLVALFEKELGADALDLLAVVAMGGSNGVTLDNAAEILSISPIKANTLAAQLAFGGVLVDLPDGAVSVRPAPLRYYLAKKVFFKQGAGIDPMRYLSKYADFADAVEVALNAGLRGGTIKKDELYVLIEKTGRPALFGGFAVFGKTEAKKVVDEHPEMALKAPREPLSVYPEGILPLMFDEAAGDKRELNRYPEHPLRIIQSWCTNVEHANDDPLPRRRALVTALAGWKGTGKDMAVLTQALVYAFSPRFEMHHTDPGAGLTLSWSNGHLSAQGMEQLIELWAVVKPLLTDLPSESWYHLIELLHEWAYERTTMGYSLNNEQSTALNKGAAMILDDLAGLSGALPGVQSQLRQVARHLGREMDSPPNPEYDTIFPPDDESRDYQEDADKQHKAIKALAVEYAKLKPDEVVSRVAEFNTQAAAARQTWPDHTSLLAAELAKLVDDPASWAEAAISGWDNPTFVLPFLLDTQSKDPEAARSLLVMALQHDRHKYAAAEVILRRPFQEDELWKQLYPLLADMARTADILVLRKLVNDKTTIELLKHPDNGVALMVAGALSHNFQGNIPAALLSVWEDALLRYQFKDGHTTNEHHVSHTLQQHPATIPKWLTAKINEKPTGYFDGFSREAGVLIGKLTNEQRLELIKMLPDTERAAAVVGRLVGANIGLYEELLRNGKTKSYQLNPLERVSGDTWVTFVEAALGAGWDEDDISSYSLARSDGWTGPASEHYGERAALYAPGLASNNPRVVSIARRCTDIYEGMRQREITREKKRDIYGFDS